MIYRYNIYSDIQVLSSSQRQILWRSFCEKKMSVKHFFMEKFYTIPIYVIVHILWSYGIHIVKLWYTYCEVMVHILWSRKILIPLSSVSILWGKLLNIQTFVCMCGIIFWYVNWLQVCLIITDKCASLHLKQHRPINA